MRRSQRLHKSDHAWPLPERSWLNTVLTVLTFCGLHARAGDETGVVLQLIEPAWQDLRETSFFTGFAEARIGARTQHDPRQKDLTLGETRLQLDYEGEIRRVLLQVTTDLVYDGVANDHSLDLEEGTGWMDLRELSAMFTPVHFADVKVGRQTLTWGTGDLLFINDLFPKDWNAFFIGRDEEYLKAPSDALKVSLFSDPANLDIVYTPRFDTNRYPDNRRLTQWNPFANQPVGDEVDMVVDKPDDWFSDDELALRLYRVVSGYELAAYAYSGFWKDPKGFDRVSMEGTFPELNVIGASGRGTLLGGIANVEIGYYDSADDRSGQDRLVPNSQFRVLLGYERELARDLTGSIQYYLEVMDDYPAYKAATPPGYPLDDEDRHVLTLRLTQLLLRQNLTLSFFTYWSPSDRDAYIRPRIHYKASDNLAVEVGGNLFLGESRHTFFGQFDDNTNLYAGVRYSF